MKAACAALAKINFKIVYQLHCFFVNVQVKLAEVRRHVINPSRTIGVCVDKYDSLLNGRNVFLNNLGTVLRVEASAVHFSFVAVVENGNDGGGQDRDSEGNEGNSKVPVKFTSLHGKHRLSR